MGQRRQISGMRVLITGASQGIGRALALAASRRGARVLAVARNAALLNELTTDAQKAGHNLEVSVADITDHDDRLRLVDVARTKFGGLDILVNNAGIGATGHFVEATADRLRQIFEVNFFGLTEVTRACLPLLQHGTKPVIVNISSIAGKRAIPARSEYSASKFAVEGFSQALRAEMTKFGIDVLVVAPGLTQTNFSQNMIEQKALMAMDHMRGMSSEEVALRTIQAIECGRNNTVLSFKGKLLSFFSRFLPRLADRIAARKVRSLFREEIARRKKN